MHCIQKTPRGRGIKYIPYRIALELPNTLRPRSRLPLNSAPPTPNSRLQTVSVGIFPDTLLLRKGLSLNCDLILPVPGFLVFFGSRGNAHAAQLLGIIFAKQHVPLLAAFQNLF